MPAIEPPPGSIDAGRGRAARRKRRRRPEVTLTAYEEELLDGILATAEEDAW